MNIPQSISKKLIAGLLAAVTMVTPALAVTGTVVADGGLRLRSEAGTNSAIITTIPNGAEVEVLSSTENGWFQVSFHNTMGYVAGEYLVLNEAEEDDVMSAPAPSEEAAEVLAASIGSEAQELAAASSEDAQVVYGRVSEGPLNVRSAPNTDAPRVKQLYTGCVVEILGESGGWYQIDGGYICADYVRIIDADEAEAATGASAVVEYAMQFLGYPYVYGGASPRGFDCSGFVKYVYAHFGFTLNRTASAQMDNGTPVSMSELIPGDVVFFKKPGSYASRASHVGIYIGGGQFIHASTSTTGVIISDMDYAYYTTGFVGARRLIF